MADRTVPRLPKLPELTKLQALLLLGGAFVFGMGVWASGRYDVFVDRTPSAPEGAVFAATLDRTVPYWSAFEAVLPEKARQAFSVAAGLETVTLFAVPGTGAELEWWTVEAMSAVTERTGRKRLRIVPQGTAAVGEVRLADRAVPFHASVTRGQVQARVGRTYLGPTFRANPFDKGRRQLVPLQGQTAYLEKPSGVSWGASSAYLSANLQRFQPLAGLWGLPGRLEFSVNASSTQALNDFVLYYRPQHGGSLAGPVLESHARALLAESDPVGFEVALPDDTEMTELRREPDAVLTTRKPVNTFGTRAQLRAPGGSHQMEIFYADDGEAWLSGDLKLIQASIMGNIGGHAPSGECEEGGRHGFAALSGKSLQSWPYFENFDRVTISLHDIETGMFTTCGYFTP